MKNIIINQIKTIFNLLKTIPVNVRFDDNWTYSTPEKSVQINTNVFNYKAENMNGFAALVRILINVKNNYTAPNLSFQPTLGYGQAGTIFAQHNVQYVTIEYSGHSGWSLNGVTYNCDESEAIEKIHMALDKHLDQFLNPVTYYFYWNDGRRTWTNKTGTIAEIMEAEDFPNWKEELICYVEAARDRAATWDAENKVWQF